MLDPDEVRLAIGMALYLLAAVSVGGGLVLFVYKAERKRMIAVGDSLTAALEALTGAMDAFAKAMPLLSEAVDAGTMSPSGGRHSGVVRRPDAIPETVAFTPVRSTWRAGSAWPYVVNVRSHVVHALDCKYNTGNATIFNSVSGITDAALLEDWMARKNSTPSPGGEYTPRYRDCGVCRPTEGNYP